MCDCCGKNHYHLHEVGEGLPHVHDHAHGHGHHHHHDHDHDHDHGPVFTVIEAAGASKEQAEA